MSFRRWDYVFDIATDIETFHCDVKRRYKISKNKSNFFLSQNYLTYFNTVGVLLRLFSRPFDYSI